MNSYRAKAIAQDRDLQLLKRELATATESVSENNETLTAYMLKIKRLEEKVQAIQRKNRQFFLRKWYECSNPPRMHSLQGLSF